MPRRLLASIAVIASFFSMACTEGQDVARFAGSDATSDSGAALDVHVPSKCPSGTIDVGPLCIDATEVTRGAYAAFLATTPPTPRAECGWNGDLAPTHDESPGVGCTPDRIDLDTHPDLPVVCVDWCDADAYCTSLGRRLCGAIGGGPDAYDDLPAENDPSKSQWYLACAGEEKRAYPYGDAYVPGACRDKTNAPTDAGLASANVGSTPGCHGPIGTPNAAVFDLSGNVAEWVDACQASAGDPQLQSCTLRGGYFGNDDTPDGGPVGFLGCPIGIDTQLRQPRARHDDHIGFRCCVSP